MSAVASRFVWTDGDLDFGPTVAAGDFDPDKHPRDEKGQFAEVEGETMVGHTKGAGDTSLRGADGQPLQMSARALSQLVEVKPGTPALKSQLASVRPEALEAAANKAIMGTPDTPTKDGKPAIGPDHMEGHDVASIPGNLAAVADSAIERYRQDPDLIQGDRFYEQWNFTAKALSDETNIDMDRIVSAMAALSPGKQTESELREITDISRFMSANDGRGVTIDDPEYIADRFQMEVDSLRSKLDDPATAGNDRTKYEEKLGALELSTQLLRDGSDAGIPVYMNDLPGLGAARFAQEYEKDVRAPDNPKFGDTGPIPLLPGTPDSYERRGSLDKGFGVGQTGYENYQKAIDVLRGYSIMPDGTRVDRGPTDREILSGIKVRSFYNNIADPNDEQGANSVTMDFHMADMALNVIGMTNFTNWESSPSIAGVSLGVRPFIADGVRDLAPRLSEALGEPLSGARVQEILWAERDRMERTGVYATAPGEPVKPYDPLRIPTEHFTKADIK